MAKQLEDILAFFDTVDAAEVGTTHTFQNDDEWTIEVTVDRKDDTDTYVTVTNEGESFESTTAEGRQHYIEEAELMKFMQELFGQPVG